MKIVCLSKDTTNIRKNASHILKDIFGMHISDKGPIFRTYPTNLKTKQPWEKDRQAFHKKRVSKSLISIWKKYLVSLPIKERQIKATMRYVYIPTVMSEIKELTRIWNNWIRLRFLWETPLVQHFGKPQCLLKLLVIYLRT